MDVGEWLARAEREQSSNLHKFNFERERSYGCQYLDASHTAFADFLALIDEAVDVRSADAILAEYSAGLSHPRRGLDDTANDSRYLPPGLKMGSRQVFLKHLGIDSAYLRRIGFKDVDIRKAEADITAVLRKGAAAGPIEKELQDIVEAVVPRAADPVALRRAFRGSTARHPTMTAPPAGFGDEPWWFTFEDSLIEEEKALPKRGHALERSGYVAGVRAALGLDNRRDVDTDSDVATAGTFRFRVLFQLTTDIPEALNHPWRQPALFSGGIPYLFVSNPRSDNGGRTVRLIDRTCGGHTGCSCGADGLPEGVVPGYVVMTEAPSRGVRGIFLVLHRDLARYGAPSCDEIRGRRAA